MTVKHNFKFMQSLLHQLADCNEEFGKALGKETTEYILKLGQWKAAIRSVLLFGWRS